MLVWYTGSRVKPCRAISAIASAIVALSGSAATSVRGTMTSRVTFSAKSDTASRNASSTSSRPASSSPSSVVRSSSSTVHALEMRSPPTRCTAQTHTPARTFAIGARTRVSQHATGAAASATRSGLATPTVRGNASISANAIPTATSTVTTIRSDCTSVIVRSEACEASTASARTCPPRVSPRTPATPKANARARPAAAARRDSSSHSSARRRAPGRSVSASR